jgi:hypothetical protein
LCLVWVASLNFIDSFAAFLTITLHVGVICKGSVGIASLVYKADTALAASLWKIKIYQQERNLQMARKPCTLGGVLLGSQFQNHWFKTPER